MAITFRTVTGNAGRLLGEDFDATSVQVLVRTNLPAGTVPIDLDHNRLLLGSDSATVDNTGDFTIPNLVDHASIDVNPTGIQYAFDIRYIDPSAPADSSRWRTWRSGWLSITANEDLSDMVARQYSPPEFQSDFLDQANAILAAQIDLSGIDDSDSEVAGLIGNPLLGPLTQHELSLSYAQRVARTKHAPAFGLYFPEAEGAVADGTTDDAAAIIAAEVVARAAGGRLHMEGSYAVASTVTIACDCDLSLATFNVTATTGVALRFGTATSGTYFTNLKMIGPKRMNAVAKTVTGWAQVAGLVALEIANLINCEVWVGNHVNFETGLQCKAKGVGANYNRVHINHLENNKVNLYMTADATGSMNESKYFCGRFSHYSGEGAAVAGTRHIEMAVCTNALNNNVFYSPCVEGNEAEFALIISGDTNRFLHGRYEVAGGAKVKWASDATRNLIDGGENAGAIVETFVAGSTRTNRIKSATKELGSMDGGTAGQFVWEGGSSTHPIVVIQDPGSRVSGADPATAYRIQMTADQIKLKAQADANPKVILDTNAGRVYISNGIAVPSAYIGALGSATLASSSNWCPTSNVALDLGTASFFWRAVNAAVHVNARVTPTFAAAQTVTFTAGALAILTLTNNLTSLTFAGGTTDGVYELHLVQDATGSRTLSAPAAAIKWAGGAPTLTATASKRDIFRFRYDGTNWWEISRSMNVG